MKKVLAHHRMVEFTDDEIVLLLATKTNSKSVGPLANEFTTQSKMTGSMLKTLDSNDRPKY